MYPKGADVREVCIKFHSKGHFFRDCSRLHTALSRQARADYIRFLDHCRSGYGGRNFNRKRKIGGEERNYRYVWKGHQKHGQGGRGYIH